VTHLDPQNVIAIEKKKKKSTTTKYLQLLEI